MAEFPNILELFKSLGLGAKAARVSTGSPVASGVSAQITRQAGQENIESAQRKADIAGTIDPSGVIDAGNAIVYTIRAFRDKERRGEHLKNAAISALGIVPYIGDLAKIPRLMRGARSTAGAARAAQASQRTPLASGADLAMPMHRVLDRGSNFGDVMSGKKTMEQARTEAEGDEKEERAREKLISVIKRTTGVFGTLTLGSVALAKSIHAVGAAMIARQRELQHLDPTIAFAGAQLDIARTQRQVERGQLTGGSFKELANAVNQLEEEFAPYSAAAINIGNRILELAVRGVTAVIAIAEKVPGVKEAIDGINRSLSKREREGMAPYVQLLADIRDGKLKKKPKRKV